MGDAVKSTEQDKIDIAYRWYELEYLPDLSLKRYSSFAGRDPLPLFPYLLQPLHRLCLLYNLRVHLLYTADPLKNEGRKFSVYLGFAGDKGILENATLDRLLHSSQLAAYFPLKKCNDEAVESLQAFCNRLTVGGTVTKSEYFPKAAPELGELIPGEGGLPKIYVERGFHHVRPWKKTNKSCRLIALANLMRSLAIPCMYKLTLEPAEMEKGLQKLYEQESMGPLYYLQRMGQKPYKSSTGISEPIPDNTREIKKYFEDAMEELQKNPHCMARIEFWSDSTCPVAPRLMAEVALTEAVEESVYTYYQYDENLTGSAYPIHEKLILPTDSRCPKPLHFLPSLFTVTEIMPFFRFPVLHEGEWIGMFKETDPAICLKQEALTSKNETISLGEIIEIGKTDSSLQHENKNDSKRTFELPIDALAKHALVVGMPGSGKTNTLMRVVHSLSALNIPFMIIEPAKREHRGLLNLMPNSVRLLTPGNPSPGLKGFKLRLNMFSAPVGFPIAEHINNLRTTFEGAFPMFNPLPFLLDKALYNAYTLKGIDPLGVMPSSLPNGLPCMEDLTKLMRKEAEIKGYTGEIGTNIRAALDARFDSLSFGLNNDVFNSLTPTFTHEELLQQSMIVETESLGKYGNLLALLLFTQLREALSVTRNRDKRALRHLLVIEEAHNIIGQSSASDASADNANPKIAATNYLIKMLAEVRALGQGIIIADQIPSALADEVIKNTNIKICHRLSHISERETMGRAMLATDQQTENMAIQQPGLTLVTQEKLLKPFQVQITPADEQWRHIYQPANEELIKLDSGAIEREALEKWREAFSKIKDQFYQFQKFFITRAVDHQKTPIPTEIIQANIEVCENIACQFKYLLTDIYEELCKKDVRTVEEIEDFYQAGKKAVRFWMMALHDVNNIEQALLEELQNIRIQQKLVPMLLADKVESVSEANQLVISISKRSDRQNKLFSVMNTMLGHTDCYKLLVETCSELSPRLPEGALRNYLASQQESLQNLNKISEEIACILANAYQNSVVSNTGISDITVPEGTP